MIPITHARLRSQCLTGSSLETPEEVVRRLGAVQSQDFGPGKWSIAQRAKGVTDAAMNQAFAAGTILRTHILRPTWHSVLPDDIHWMLALTAPRIQALNASYYRAQELDGATRASCTDLLAGALEGGQHLTRKEIAGILERAGIDITPLRLTYILMCAELEGIICSGIPRGKQQTYALLAERAPQARRLNREEALAELTLRYFTGHGPATVKDLRWWSSLTMADIKQGLAMVASQLEREEIDGKTYWFAAPAPGGVPSSPAVHLIQGYDEYLVGYGDSKYLADVSGVARSGPRPRGIYTHAVLLDGQIAGQWKPIPRKDGVTIEVKLFTPFDDAQTQSLHAAVQRYGAFLEMPATLAHPG